MPRENYGDYYWIVEVPPEISTEGWISIHADDVSVSPSGDLIFTNHSRAKNEEGESRRSFPGMILAAGHWKHCHAADAVSGDPIVVDFWAMPDYAR